MKHTSDRPISPVEIISPDRARHRDSGSSTLRARASTRAILSAVIAARACPEHGAKRWEPCWELPSASGTGPATHIGVCEWRVEMYRRRPPGSTTAGKDRAAERKRREQVRLATERLTERFRLTAGEDPTVLIEAGHDEQDEQDEHGHEAEPIPGRTAQ